MKRLEKEGKKKETRGGIKSETAPNKKKQGLRPKEKEEKKEEMEEKKVGISSCQHITITNNRLLNASTK